LLSFSGSGNTEEVSTNAYFSVGSTIVLLLAALSRNAATTIELAAYEPHVMNIIEVMRSAGAQIALRYDHTIIVSPAPLVSEMSGRVIGDYIVSGTLAVI
jgi:UDP-N-acetylglucosamine enolpyruvyl transferase